ncbi:hypothetical protein BCV71DRAFT_230665 [Rhizopus microsporus]|uniref:Uncharacterized protein n=1 Tax=Rhizopus microsporus TaxID=58291 RepID=A0A1X0SG93_RHIZD|nr:hypothetical protein BCV71DRAFT_230665 [Rhizopus microsporus]
MSTIFLYEDGHGNVIDENGGPEPIDYIAETIAETIATHTEKAKNEDVHMKEANPKRDYVRYIVQDKARFFDLKIEECMTASAAAKQLSIRFRTAYRWVSQRWFIGGLHFSSTLYE